LDDADHAGARHATVQRDAPICQLLRDHIGGAHFLETQFGMGVDVFANRRVKVWLDRLCAHNAGE
jgi:hypothetical protein